MPLPPLTPIDMSVPTADGIILKGTLTYPTANLGKKHPLAVLAHQYPGTRDSWAPLVADLLDLGVATLAFDQRGHGASTHGPKGSIVIDAPRGLAVSDFGDAFASSIATVEFARMEDDIVRVTGWGVSQNFIDPSRLLLVGGSVGGPGVMLASTKLAAALRGVITVGPAGAPAYGDDAPRRIRAAAEALRCPSLHMSAEDDPFGGATNARDWSEGLKESRAKIVNGADHAMAIYYDVRDTIRSFVKNAIA